MDHVIDLENLLNIF